MGGTFIFFAVLEPGSLRSLAVLVSVEASLSSLQTATFSVHVEIELHRERYRETDRDRETDIYIYISGVSSSYKNTSSIGLGFHHLTLFNINYLLKVPTALEIRETTYEFWGNTI